VSESNGNYKEQKLLFRKVKESWMVELDFDLSCWQMPGMDWMI
jgi:hypothetical protein